MGPVNLKLKVTVQRKKTTVMKLWVLIFGSGSEI
jgi:hypothetical protein